MRMRSTLALAAVRPERHLFCGRRGLALQLLICGLCAAVMSPASGQTRPPDYPSHPVTIVVSFSAGSTNDASARVIANRLSSILAQQFIVVNREGAAGSIGGQMVAKSKPDGQTLLWASSATLVTGPAFHENFAYDPITDFSPISVFCYLPYVMVIHPAVPATNPKSLLELARRQPDQLAYGSTGVGGTLHLAVELMQHMGKVRMMHVPYKGAPSMIIDLLSGQIQLAVMSVGIAMPHVASKRMRAIAVTSNQRTDLLPEVPTMDEAGLKGYDVRGWYGLVAPAKTPTAIITTLHKAFAQALEHPDAKAVIAREGARAGRESPEQFQAFLSAERETYRRLIADANLRREARPGSR